MLLRLCILAKTLLEDISMLCFARSTYNTTYRISYFNISWSGSAEHCFPMFITTKHYVIMKKTF